MARRPTRMAKKPRKKKTFTETFSSFVCVVFLVILFILSARFYAPVRLKTDKLRKTKGKGIYFRVVSDASAEICLMRKNGEIIDSVYVIAEQEKSLHFDGYLPTDVIIQAKFEDGSIRKKSVEIGKELGIKYQKRIIFRAPSGVAISPEAAKP